VKNSGSIANKEDISSANESIRFIDELNKTAFEFRHLDQKKSAELAQKALDLSIKTGYQKGQGKALLNTGFYEFTHSNYSNAFNSFSRALHIFQDIQDQEGIGHANYNLGLVYLRIGDYDNAMEVHQESLRIRKELADEEGIASCKSQIGYINSQFGHDEIAMKEYTECLAIWRKKDNKAGIGNILMALGILKTKLNKLGEAKEHLIESMNTRMQLNELNGVHASVNYLSAVYLKEGNTIEALRLLSEALETALKQDEPYVIGICRLRTGLARIYIQVKDYDNAVLQLKTALEQAIETKQQYQLHDIYLELANLYKSIKVYDKALENYEKFHESKEAIISLNAAAKLKNLEMVNKVELSEKETEIHRLKNVELKERNKIIREERKKSDKLLLNILPSQTARELKKYGTAKTRRYELVTILFSDFVNFTQAAEKLSPENLVKCIDEYFRAFDEIIIKNKIEKIKTIGDAYMAAGGVPVANTTNPVDVINAGLEILEHVKKQNNPLFNVRIGVHSGPVVAGIVGIIKFAYDIWGDAVNIASRMESSGESGRLNISGYTYELVKDHFTCFFRGKIKAKNKGIIDMYFVDEEKSIDI